MGEGEHHGIVPQFAKELFDRVEGTTDDEVCVCIHPCVAISVCGSCIYVTMLYVSLCADNFQSPSELL